MLVHPYLCFEGRCEEAIEFYKETLGAEVIFMMRGSEMPEVSGAACQAEGAENSPTFGANKIVHASVKVGNAELLMSDGMCTGQTDFKGITLSVSVDSDDQAVKTFQALSQGGQVMVPLSQTFFASQWGVCNDKFGVPWMVLTPAPVPA